MTIPIFDAHCDTITKVLEEGGGLRKNGFHLDLKRLSAYAPAAQFFAVWGGRYEEKAALLKAELEKNADLAVFCRTAEEAKSAAREGKIAAFLSVEGAEQLGCSAQRLFQAHTEDGVVMVNLCWNHDNALCGSAMDSGGGLTEDGRAFVRAAQAMGVAVDLSHASERTFWDVAEIAQKPILASHSNAAALYARFPRNLTDAQFRALVQMGGGAGLNLCPAFLSEKADVDACVAHVEHFLDLGGAGSVFIGADLDGISETPAGIGGVQDLGKIYEALLRRNHPEQLVRDIFYNNFMTILERAL